MDPSEQMIETQIEARGVRDPAVLDAMRSVPRHLFVPDHLRASAYGDEPLPIGEGQSISQPYIVALMTSLLELRSTDRVLEIGSGSGYQTAILARLAHTVYSAEIKPSLLQESQSRLASLGIRNVVLRQGDGVSCFRDQAPFDAILVAAAPITIPEELLEQLGDGGRCVIPAGEGYEQTLWLISRTGEGFERKAGIPVRFVPLV